jgi:gliding motility-associated-like protein
MIAHVDSLPTVTISGIPNVYCFKDTTLSLTGTPAGGVWGGAVMDSTFNPSLAGAGTHTISYTIGSGDCSVTATFTVQVRDQLLLNMAYTDTVLCHGGDIRISGIPNGGDPLHYDFSWDHGLGHGSSFVVTPDTTTTYVVHLSDGCSTPLTGFVHVFMPTPIYISFDTSDIQCYGKAGWAEVHVAPVSSYAFEWNTTPHQTTNRVEGFAGLQYVVNVTDNITHCSVSGTVSIPSYGKIYADFVPTPNGRCVDMSDPHFQFIDLSVGGTKGAWHFGDGIEYAYSPLNNPIHGYPLEGKYLVVLNIENDGGCVASHVEEVCVDPFTEVLVPTAFSPNHDGTNDRFRPHLIGADKLDMKIYNRWGQLLFETNDAETGWDGTYAGHDEPMDSYAYVITYYSHKQLNLQTLSGYFVLLR